MPHDFSNFFENKQFSTSKLRRLLQVSKSRLAHYVADSQEMASYLPSSRGWSALTKSPCISGQKFKCKAQVKSTTDVLSLLAALILLPREVLTISSVMANRKEGVLTKLLLHINAKAIFCSC